MAIIKKICQYPRPNIRSKFYIIPTYHHDYTSKGSSTPQQHQTAWALIQYKDVILPV